ncbi:hypothetical protein [Polyangium aurulentum]|uniref:hypothetical protein n=1 Tax=Polyangium aurulentum TaxID=2567896 RepID=UPI00146CAD0D|nr:hypothetical protein [Polyangium aurulentum]UQA57036.1 hypothetical protein E8A73_037955 [Polyangium aurulentum]
MAARRFGERVCAFLRNPRKRTLRIVAAPEDQASVVQMLRLIEHAPDNRRPFFLYEEPFTDETAYFDGLVMKLADDAAQLGMPTLRLPREGDARSRAALVVARVAEQLGDGMLVGLVPREAPPEGFARAWLPLWFPEGVKLAVLGADGCDAEARFALELREVASFIKADPLAADKSPEHMIALAGVELAAGNREAARSGFVAAAKLAETTGDARVAEQARRAADALAG